MAGSDVKFEATKIPLTQNTFHMGLAAVRQDCQVIKEIYDDRENVLFECLSRRINAARKEHELHAVYATTGERYSFIPADSRVQNAYLNILRGVATETSEQSFHIDGVVQRMFVIDDNRDGTEEIYTEVVNGEKREYFKIQLVPAWFGILGRRNVVEFLRETTSEGEEALKVSVENVGCVVVTQGGSMVFSGTDPRELMTDVIQMLANIEREAEEYEDAVLGRASGSAQDFILNAQHRFLARTFDNVPEIPIKGDYTLQSGKIDIVLSPLSPSKTGVVKGVVVTIDPPGWGKKRFYLMNRRGELAQEIPFELETQEGDEIKNHLINTDIPQADRSLISAAILAHSSQEQDKTRAQWFRSLFDRMSALQ